ncbi:MAG: methylmalonyl Co-A mutase-associated GTPase MeaB [Dehalococcoidia bacterium]
MPTPFLQLPSLSLITDFVNLHMIDFAFSRRYTSPEKEQVPQMKLANEILEGNIRAAAKLIRYVEDGAPDAVEELKKLYFHTGKAYIIGITGAPGSGKSTLIDVLIDSFRKRNKTVGVIVIDPSSPFSGGAILGDRIRMQRHATDQGVFIRSLATRGWLGGLSKATIDVIHIMDALGKDIILVETVGVGQAEVAIMNFVHTATVVLMPGSGDWVQTLKAGILEIADLLVINKADMKGVYELEAELKAMLQMKDYPRGVWKPRILVTEAINDKGTEELMKGIYEHREFLVTTGKYDTRVRQSNKQELLEVLKCSLLDTVFQKVDKNDYVEKVIDDLVNRRKDPYSAVSEIINKLTGEK